MTYTVNPDGTVTFNKQTSQEKESWREFLKDVK